ncbi:Endochitinase 1 [Bulinus truncatus]|nr:Endochitinase 1 [Bulinus truncatus]
MGQIELVVNIAFMPNSDKCISFSRVYPDLTALRLLLQLKALWWLDTVWLRHLSMVSTGGDEGAGLQSSLVLQGESTILMAWIWTGSSQLQGSLRPRANMIAVDSGVVTAFLKVKLLNKPRLILSAAIAAGKQYIDAGYEIGEIANYLDMVNLMSYDFHGTWEGVTGHHSPLYGRTGEIGSQFNIDYAARYLTDLGLPKAKLNIGLATYGISFTLSNEDQYDVGAPISGAGTAGQFTRQQGFLAYYEICSLVSSGADVYNAKDQQVPYVVKNSQWVGYDDPDSLRNKVRYIKQNGYGGSMIWSLDLDDFRGYFCGLGRFPLVSAVSDECTASDIDMTSPRQEQLQDTTPISQQTQDTTLISEQPQDTTLISEQPQDTTLISEQPQDTTLISEQPQVTTPQTQRPQDTTQISSINSETMCRDQNLVDGNYADPNSCNGYISCSGGYTYTMPCPDTLVYNARQGYCDYLHNVPECQTV